MTRFIGTFIMIFITLNTIYSQNTTLDSIIIDNLSAKTFDFSFVNEMEDQVILVCKPKSRNIIKTNSIINLIESNKYQTLYILKKGDVLELTASDLGNAIFKDKNSNTRSDEINLFRRVNESSSINYYQFLVSFNKLIKKDCKNLYKECDIYFTEKIKALNNLLNANHYDPKFTAISKTILEAEFYQTKMSIISKCPFDFDERTTNTLDSGVINIKQGLLSNPQLLTNFVYSEIIYSQRMSPSISRIYNNIKTLPKQYEKEQVLFRFFKNNFESNIDSIRSLAFDYIEEDHKNEFKDFLKSQLSSIGLTRNNNDSLINLDNKKATLMHILSSSKSKILYVDFWASWCKPCREEMPHSLALSKKITNEKVSFVYISIDDSNEEWKKASLKEKLPVNYSYWLPNFTFSSFAKKIKLKTIPRYIVLNKNGDILNFNAPRPSDKKLSTMLDKLSSK